ncbi:(1-_4)-alpha-D-glucan 1-alpha-D-glucosylmutase [Pseudomonas duriflava]|uniref:(1->4)-alpha-D-glucan 1-alpha-D-glucosylmutase n=1 Tax=Pseudomonas duriflava TaxID=459528 RepID=A0A562Q7P8_9PSED|nr:malto-oligosyltrehalose synthase [Pseudomonas duriflava]TWI52738.1 (1->4)-alpha-D-glucan 1-alpha-D-glucosylmutase [Pseudomonas duriflava]
MSQLRATVRLQFHKDFTFDDALPLVDYYADLGISHFYASPVTTARAGSVHGYDVVDPTRVNPELGGEEALRRLVARLHERGMGLIVDFVPNHMSVGGSENFWWLDVLKWGRHSPYARFYDINWHSPDPELQGQLLLPFLGSAYGDILQAGELKLVFDEKDGFRVEYYAHHFPISPPTYADILRQGDQPELRLFADAFEAREDDREGAEEALRQLADSLKQNPATRAALDKCLEAFDATDAANHERLHALLERQHYRLASWRTASDDINWRRFFDITELGGLRMERPEVFEAMHEMTFRLIREGLVDGLRLDHIDGLANPRSYCRKLRRQIDDICASRPGGAPEGGFPIYVEKILAEGEHLREDWGIDGTTGYEFMNEVSSVMHDPTGEKPLTEFWAERTGRPADFMEEVREARRLVVTTALASEFESTAHTLHVVAQQDWRTRDTSLGAIRRVLLELIVHFPVYRTYVSAAGFTGEDEKFFQKAVEGARPNLSEAELPVLDLLHQWLGGKAPCRQSAGSLARREQRRAITKFQQLTSPVAAKAVEDTACYRSGALLSRNDVGFDPQNFSQTPEEFHETSQWRSEHFPRNMLTTATHDHKRGEDTRARLAVLSEMATDYIEAASHWMKLAAPLRGTYADKPAPTPGDELMLYQTLLASWPLNLRADDAEGLKAYLERLLPWQEKALREEKLESDWWTPNADYETACRRFLEGLLTGEQGTALRHSLVEMVERIAPAGALNGLVQALLRMTAPGVPDLYQGCDFWDFSLVEPDNRRAVNYPPRIAALKESKAPAELLKEWKDGRVKQRVIALTLAVRQAHPELFTQGSYTPLTVVGAQAEHVLAFAREHQGKAAILVVPLRSWPFLNNASIPFFEATAWQDTRIKVPDYLAGRSFTETFSHSSVHVKQSELKVSELLANFPLGLLITQDLAQGETQQ